MRPPDPLIGTAEAIQPGEERQLRLRNSPSPAWSWVMLAAIPVVIRLLSRSIMEAGDGIAHYQIAAFSWQHPELFLDVWGKPLFTLLSSPFAQLGHWGMTVFNAFCFIGTAWAADGLLKRAGAGARWLFAPVLLLVPVYGMMVLAGMTEVLFGLLTVLAIRAAIENRPTVLALVVSVMPFSRPEAIAFMPFAFLWLAMNKHWKALPFLLTGNIVYALFAAIVFNDPFWAWNGDPYRGAKDIYGSGPWDHFIGNLDMIYGPVYIGSVIAMGVAVAAWRSAEFVEQGGRTLVLLALLPTIAILLLHSYLWWHGLKGSLGLNRVMATTAPMIVLFNLWMIYWALTRMMKFRIITALITVLIAAFYLPAAANIFLEERPLPVGPDDQQDFLLRVGERVMELKDEGDRVAYHSPFIAYAAEIDPFSEDTRVQIDWRDEDLGLIEGDLVIWDAHFSPNEGYTDLDVLLEHPALRFIDRMEPSMEMIVIGGRQFEVFIFERRNTRRWSGTIDILDQKKRLVPQAGFRSEIMDDNDAEEWRFEPVEFPFEITDLPTGKGDALYSRITVSGSLDAGPNVDPPLLLVFEEKTGGSEVSYKALPLVNGAFERKFQVPLRGEDVKNKMYIWNRSKQPFSIKDMHISVFQHRSEEIGSN